ncbi:MAG: glycosyltransferase [Micropepsaceae bacterium]
MTAAHAPVEAPTVQSAKRPKICFLGNINSMPLIYARELRSLGADVVMYFEADQNEQLHRPEARYAEYRQLPDWLRHLNVGVRSLFFAFPNVLRSRILRMLNEQQFDGFVLNGLFITLAPYLNAKRFALLAGADLDVYCDPASFRWRKLVGEFGAPRGLARSLVFSRLVHLQRKGLAACAGTNFFAEGINPNGDALLNDILPRSGNFRIQVRGVDTSMLAYVDGSDRTGDDTEFLIPVRMVWKEPLPAGLSRIENKKTDEMLKGFAEVRRRTALKPKLFIIEKGPHVSETKELLAKLEIADQVTWLREMSQSSLLEWYRRVDVVFDQLGEHMIGGIALDAMLIGRPVIANARPEIFVPLFGEPSPICHATNATDVAAHIGRLVNSPVVRRKMGLQCREYVTRNFNGTRTAEDMLEFFRGESSTP